MRTGEFTNISNVIMYTSRAVDHLRKQWELDKITQMKPCVVCGDPIENNKVVCRKCAHAMFVGSHLAKPSRQCGKTTLNALIFKDIMDYEFGIDISVEKE